MKTLLFALTILGLWFSATFADADQDPNNREINLSETESKILKIVASVSLSSDGKLLTVVFANENPEPLIISISSLVSPRFTASFRVDNGAWASSVSALFPSESKILTSINNKHLSADNEATILLPATGTVTAVFDFMVLEKQMLSAFQNQSQNEAGAKLSSFSLQFSDLFVFPESKDSDVRSKLSTPTLHLGKP